MKASNFNNFPEGFPHPIKEYGDQTVTFRLCNLQKDPDDETGKRYLMAGSDDVRLTDTIQWKDKETGETHDIHIAHIVGTTAEGEARLGREELLFTAARQGTLTLNPKNPRERRMLAYMLITSENKDSSFRNPDVKPKFYIVDKNKEAEEEISKNELIYDAMTELKSLETHQLREMFTLLFQRNSEAFTGKQVFQKLQSKALETPEDILKLARKKETSAMALAKTASQKKAIKNDQKAKAFVWKKSGETIFEYESGAGKKPPYEQFAEFLNNNPEVTEQIKGVLSLSE